MVPLVRKAVCALQFHPGHPVVVAMVVVVVMNIAGWDNLVSMGCAPLILELTKVLPLPSHLVASAPRGWSVVHGSHASPENARRRCLDRRAMVIQSQQISQVWVAGTD